jgi:hypothetical protein
MIASTAVVKVIGSNEKIRRRQQQRLIVGGVEKKRGRARVAIELAGGVFGVQVVSPVANLEHQKMGT